MNNHFGRSTTQASKQAVSPLGPLKALASVARFSGEFLVNPSSTGSLVPSMPALGRRMAGYVTPAPNGYVVELGAGTGAITKALLQRGIPPEQIISIDCSNAMAKVLRKRYPELKILVGNAAQLQAMLSDHINLQTDSISYIVSSLPLRSLPKSEVEDITREIHHILAAGGRFIQYTYDLRHKIHPALFQFRLLTSSVVWLNFPPARVSVYAR